ncbi:glycosyltransferase family 4 protein [Gellertiella hungarica]|uniref:Glycosyltransferase involved in cell wall biosynthesis n=1 Tax=Gellertiella hungarica TaxID=1572859 RepID=A0A7W6J3T4_9HYPH|nr:glycosyltransferase family 4 protein [Gellertiella hungarica]MBB4064212.1 glycosyltransferase involved in cell wall biosynthesis [Gellertiella hungarica]
MKIAHLTSAHGRFDIRIFMKECRSLVEAGHDVSLVVADGKGDQISEGVHILDTGSAGSRIDRMVHSSRRVFKRARRLRADVYHLHDPELIPWGLCLRALGAKVIFDAHEDLPKQIKSKPYLSEWQKAVVSAAVQGGEALAFRMMSGLIGATPSITKKLSAYAKRVEAINNFPLLGELEAPEKNPKRANEVCYVGGISWIRGCRELVSAMRLVTTDVVLNLVGPVQDASLRVDMKEDAGWSRVKEAGVVDRIGVRSIMARSRAGIVTFLPAPNHTEAQPNKMFEYMSAGLPVIASNFPLWREVVEGSGCGLCVDPAKPEEIARAIDWIIMNPVEAEAMGRRGQEATKNRYNWPNEAEKLVKFYTQI